MGEAFVVDLRERHYTNGDCGRDTSRVVIGVRGRGEKKGLRSLNLNNRLKGFYSPRNGITEYRKLKGVSADLMRLACVLKKLQEQAGPTT